MALCHFCEEHGPRVVMTTQALKRTGIQRHANVDEDEEKGEKKKEEPRYKMDILSVNEFGKVDFDTIPQITDEDVVFASWDRTIELVDDESRCEACSSVGPNASHIANDYLAGRSYVTTQTAINEDAYAVTQSVCFKAHNTQNLLPLTLTSLEDDEPTPSTSESSKTEDGEGIIFFGKAQDKYTAVGRMFALKDAKSRGFKRRYGLLCISQNHQLLTWKFKDIMVEVNMTADLLKLSAEKVHDCEQEIDKDQVIRSGQVLGWIQGHEQPKIEYDTSRSFTKIVGNEEAFFTLHRDCVSILQILLKPDATMKFDGMSNLSVSRYVERAAEAMAIAATEDFAVISKKIEQPELKAILIHLVRGGQMICQCDYAPVRSKFLFAFSVLLPNTLVDIASDQRKYCIEKNLLGVDECVPLPTPEQYDLVIIKLVKTYENECYGVADFDVNVVRLPEEQLEPVPSVVSKYLGALENEIAHTTTSILHKALTTIKEEFMTLVTSISSTYPTTARIAALLKVHSKPVTDLHVYQFWKLAKLRVPRNGKLISISEEPSFPSKPIQDDLPTTRKVSASIPIPARKSVCEDDVGFSTLSSSMPSVFSSTNSLPIGTPSTGSFAQTSPLSSNPSSAPDSSRRGSFLNSVENSEVLDQCRPVSDDDLFATSG
uniref:Folliculin n=1 Tax=Panagrellus redivivus TaxID=6233 RepID=A0A7E4V0V6_PANRE